MNKEIEIVQTCVKVIRKLIATQKEPLRPDEWAAVEKAIIIMRENIKRKNKINALEKEYEITKRALTSLATDYCIATNTEFVEIGSNRLPARPEVASCFIVHKKLEEAQKEILEEEY